MLFTALQITISSIAAQVPSNPIGHNPLSLKWNQINTDKVRVIFPQGLGEEGLRVAQWVHYLWEKQDSTIGPITDKVTILVNTLPVAGNGFVTVGPFRSEFFPTPRQFWASHNYLDNLTIHEYRHVQQFNNSVQGITKTVKNVFGSWAWGGMLSMALPRWYLEGDAVIAESEFTNSGRGTWAPFLMEYNALVASDKIYGFEKAAAGSLKDFVPSWYHLGYQMLTMGRDQFGDDLWAGVAKDAVRFKGLLFPFSSNLKRRTGWDAKRLYGETVNRLRTNWSPTGLQQPTQTQRINTRIKNTVTHYNNPHFANDSTWIAVMNSYEDLSAIVRIDAEGNEKKILEPGILLQSTTGSVSVCESKIAWTAYSRDPRRQNRSYSDIYVYDIDARRKKKITHRGRFYSPELSKDGRRVAAVRIDANLDHHVVILDLASGTVVDEIALTEFRACQFPVWDDYGNIILVVSTDRSNQLVILDPVTQEIKALTPETPGVLSHPVHYGDDIYFSWAPSTVNNIYAVSSSTRQIRQITFSSLGAFQPDVSSDGKRLTYAAFTADGYDIHQLELSDSEKIGNTSMVPAQSDRLNQKNYFGPPVTIASDSFSIVRFNKWSGILNPHSLLAEIYHPVASLRLLSDNTFGTMSGEAGAFYNYNENEWSYGANLTYAELYPVINTGFVHANRSAAFVNYGPLTDSTYRRQVSAREWNENRIQLGLSVPLEVIAGNFLHSFEAGVNYNYIDLNVGTDFDPSASARSDTISYESNRSTLTPIFAQPISSSSFHSLDMRLSFQFVKRPARLHVRPRLGMAISLSYRANLGDPDLGGNVFTAGANVLLPGMAKNHSLQLSASYQNERRLDNYRFSDRFRYPRGYDFGLRRDEFFTWRAEYMLPLLYPDQAIGPLAFVKRVKLNAFYDHGVFKITEEALPQLTEKMRAFGVELNFDFRAFRLVEVDFGIRYSYLMDDRFVFDNNRHVLDFFVVSIRQ